MLKHLIVCLALAAGLSACASSTAISPRIDIIDRPPLTTTAQVELGDTVVEKGRLSTYDGLWLKNELTWGDGFLLKKFNIQPGRLRARQQDKTFIYFLSDKMTVYDAILGTAPYAAGGVCTKKTDPSFVRAFIVIGACNIRPKASPEVQPVRITDMDAPGFRQELIYNGRSGDTVKFLYREFSGDYARPPFSQDVQYDLKDGMMIGFKGVRIEIVEATNTRLVYRVLASFPDPV